MQAPDAPVNAGRMAGKVVVDQSSARDTHAECDSPRKAAMQSVVAASPKPSTATALDAPPSIWEKLASHEVRRGRQQCVECVYKMCKDTT